MEFAVGMAVRRPVEPGFVPLPNGAFPPPIVLTVGEGFINPVEVVELAGPLLDGVFSRNDGCEHGTGRVRTSKRRIDRFRVDLGLVDGGLVDRGLVDGGLEDVELAEIPTAGMLANSDRRIPA